MFGSLKSCPYPQAEEQPQDGTVLPGKGSNTPITAEGVSFRKIQINDRSLFCGWVFKTSATSSLWVFRSHKAELLHSILTSDKLCNDLAQDGEHCQPSVVNLVVSVHDDALSKLEWVSEVAGVFALIILPQN